VVSRVILREPPSIRLGSDGEAYETSTSAGGGRTRRQCRVSLRRSGRSRRLGCGSTGSAAGRTDGGEPLVELTRAFFVRSESRVRRLDAAIGRARCRTSGVQGHLELVRGLAGALQLARFKAGLSAFRFRRWLVVDRRILAGLRRITFRRHEVAAADSESAALSREVAELARRAWAREGSMSVDLAPRPEMRGAVSYEVRRCELGSVGTRGRRRCPTRRVWRRRRASFSDTRLRNWPGRRRRCRVVWVGALRPFSLSATSNPRLRVRARSCQSCGGASATASLSSRRSSRTCLTSALRPRSVSWSGTGRSSRSRRGCRGTMTARSGTPRPSPRPRLGLPPSGGRP